MQNLKDLVVMITGASSGFGEVTARMLVEHGAKVVLGARREDRLKALCEELGPTNAVYHVTDVTRREDLDALAKAGTDAFGRVNALVNNAGVMPLSRLQSGAVEDWDRMIDVNIKGVLYAINAVLNPMLERGSGKIVNISSVAGLSTTAVSAVYSGTKFAVKAISEGLRQECAGKVQVTCIYPGAFATELVDAITDEFVMDVFQRRNVGALAQPAERVAEAILYALNQNPDVAVNEITIRPTAQP
ncbi:SDR family oxidoreductase [bacterium AH-315-P15]|nr:SDR family oxidoreductase [bacterium AH-315-P15]